MFVTFQCPQMKALAWCGEAVPPPIPTLPPCYPQFPRLVRSLMSIAHSTVLTGLGVPSAFRGGILFVLSPTSKPQPIHSRDTSKRGLMRTCRRSLGCLVNCQSVRRVNSLKKLGVRKGVTAGTRTNGDRFKRSTTRTSPYVLPRIFRK